ncbi:ARID DNA-binding domain-containing protein, partial [Tanacetum coccineum]
MAIGWFKIGHYSKKKIAMVNDKADEIWRDLQNEEASSSSTPAEIYMEKLVIIWSWLFQTLKELDTQKKPFMWIMSGNLPVLVHASYLSTDCPKAPARVVNRMDKGKGGSSGADDESIGLFTASDGTLNEVTPVYAVKEGVAPSVEDIPGELPAIVIIGVDNVGKDSRTVVSSKELIFSFSTIMSTIVGVTPSFTVDATPTGVSSFIVSSDSIDTPIPKEKWHPDENLLKEDVSTIPVWVKLHEVPITAFSKDGLNAIATKLGTPLMLDSYIFDMCIQSWGRSSYARVMIEHRADVDHIHEECPKNTGVGEKKTLKKPIQTSGGVLVSPKMGLKPQKEYRLVPKKSTASSS